MRLSYFYICTSLFFINCSGPENDSSKNDKTNPTDTTQVQDKEYVVQEAGPQNVEFPSLDGLIISGLLYEKAVDAPTILLCHQAGYNLREYVEIAPKLNEMGYNCMAIDQRAGGILDGYVNQTADRAIDEELPVKYINAEQDIVASINYLTDKYDQDIIVWGSSYSAGLALHIGATNEKVKAVVSFSPGDYYGEDKPPLETAMQNFDLPFFITSSKTEAPEITAFLEGIELDETHVQFIPESAGKHGSKALWKEHESNQEYWDAIKSFLTAL